jgi:hypothetical protein
MARSTARTQPCSNRDAKARLAHARKFLEVAELVADEAEDLEYSSVAAALAVLAGIAASDAACCRALGRRPRGQDHRMAIELVDQVEPGGGDAGKALRRLLALKDEAHYGLLDVSGTDLKTALRQARALVDFGAEVLLR